MDAIKNHSASGGHGNTNNAGDSSDDTPHVLVNVWSIVDGQLQKTGAKRVPASAFVEAGLPNNVLTTPTTSTISPTISSYSVPSFPPVSSSPLSSLSLATHPSSSLTLTQTLGIKPTAGTQPPLLRPQNSGNIRTSHYGGSGTSHPSSHIPSPLTNSQSQSQYVDLPQSAYSSQTGSQHQQQPPTSQTQLSQYLHQQISPRPGHQQFAHQTILGHHQRNISASQGLQQNSQGSKITLPNYQETSIQFQERPETQGQEHSEVTADGSDLPSLNNFDDYVTLLQILGANVYPPGVNSSTPTLQSLLASLQNVTSSTEPHNQSVNHNIFPDESGFPELPINDSNNASEEFQLHTIPNPTQQKQPSLLLNRLHENLQTHSRPAISSPQFGLSYQLNPSYSIPNPLFEPNFSQNVFNHKTDQPPFQRPHPHQSVQLHPQNSPHIQENQQHSPYPQLDVSVPHLHPTNQQTILRDSQLAAGEGQTKWAPTGSADKFSEIYPQPGQGINPMQNTLTNLMHSLGQHLPEAHGQTDAYTHITAPSILANLPFLSDAPSSDEMYHVLENLHTLQHSQTEINPEPSRLPAETYNSLPASHSSVNSPLGLSSSVLASANQPPGIKPTRLHGSSLFPPPNVHGLPPVKNNITITRHQQVKTSNVSVNNDFSLFSYTSSPKITNASDLHETSTLTVPIPHKSSSLSNLPSSTHVESLTPQSPVIKPFSPLSYQPPLRANKPTQIWPTGTRTQEQNLKFGQASYQPSIPPPVFLKYPQQTTTSVPRTSTASSVPFGGVGNPGLLGVPIGLQENANSFIAPTHQATQPPVTQVFGGVGNDALEGYPVSISGNFENPANEGFVSLSNHNPLINSPPFSSGLNSYNPNSPADSPQILAELQELQALNNIFSGAGVSPAEEAMKIAALQSLLTQNPDIVEQLFSESGGFNSRQGQPLTSDSRPQNVHSVDDSGYPSNFDSMHHNTGQAAEKENGGSLQGSNIPRPSFYSDEPINIRPGYSNPTIPNPGILNTNLSELPPEYLVGLMHQLGRLPPTLQELEQALSDQPGVPIAPDGLSHTLHAAQSTISPFMTDDSQMKSQDQDASHVSSDSKAEATETKNSFLSNKYVQGCLGNKWCALGLAMTVAVGATGAMAAPLVVPVLGRKRRDVADSLQHDVNMFRVSSTLDPDMNLYATLIEEPRLPSIEASYDKLVNYDQENVTDEPPGSPSLSENITNSTDMQEVHQDPYHSDAIDSSSTELEGKQTSAGLVPPNKQPSDDESTDALYILEYASDDAYQNDSYDELTLESDDVIDGESGQTRKTATTEKKKRKDKVTECLQENTCLGMVAAVEGVAFLTPFPSRKTHEVQAGIELGDRIVREIQAFLPPSDQDLLDTRMPPGTVSWRKQRVRALVEKVVHMIPSVEKLFEVFHQARVKPKLELAVGKYLA